MKNFLPLNLRSSFDILYYLKKSGSVLLLLEKNILMLFSNQRCSAGCPKRYPDPAPPAPASTTIAGDQTDGTTQMTSNQRALSTPLHYRVSNDRTKAANRVRRSPNYQPVLSRPDRSSDLTGAQPGIAIIVDRQQRELRLNIFLIYTLRLYIMLRSFQEYSKISWTIRLISVTTIYLAKWE